jgi:hypothetical protein
LVSGHALSPVAGSCGLRRFGCAANFHQARQIRNVRRVLDPPRLLGQRCNPRTRQHMLRAVRPVMPTTGSSARWQVEPATGRLTRWVGIHDHGAARKKGVDGRPLPAMTGWVWPLPNLMRLFMAVV